MGKANQQKQTQQTSQQNQYEYKQAPDNPYYKNAEQLIGGYDGGASAVREGFARNVNDINESGNEFTGANTSDYVRGKVRDSRLFRNNMDLGRGLADAKQNEIGYKNNAYMSLGGATAPQLVQSGSSGTGSGTLTPGFLDTIGKAANIGATVGS